MNSILLDLIPDASGWLRTPFSAEDDAKGSSAGGETAEDHQARLDAEMADLQLDREERERAEEDGRREDKEAYEKAKMDHLAMCQRMWQEKEATLKHEAEQRAALREKRLETNKSRRAQERNSALKEAAVLREKQRKELLEFATVQEKQRDASKEAKMRAYYEEQLARADADIRLAQLSLESTVTSTVTSQFEAELETQEKKERHKEQRLMAMRQLHSAGLASAGLSVTHEPDANGKATVCAIVPDSDAERKVKVGWALESVDGRLVSRAMTQPEVTRLLLGPMNSTVKIKFMEAPDIKEVQRDSDISPADVHDFRLFLVPGAKVRIEGGAEGELVGQDAIVIEDALKDPAAPVKVKLMNGSNVEVDSHRLKLSSIPLHFK